MRVTKKLKTEYIKEKLVTSTAWALKCLVTVYNNQTETEKSIGSTHEHNNIGFTGTDGFFMSSLAEQYNKRGFLTAKQMPFVMKRMKKYHKQVLAACDEIKLVISMMRDGKITQEDFREWEANKFLGEL